MHALLIEFDPQTGKRAGGIDPRDKGLFCYGWQNLDLVPAIEIRLVTDGRDISRYEVMSGVKVLHGDGEIDQAIEQNIPTRYGVENDTTFRMHCERRGINFDDYAGKTMQEILADLHAKGIEGIRKTECLRMADVRKLRESTAPP